MPDEKYEIDCARDRFLVNEEATFTLKKNERFLEPWRYIWKVNDVEMSYDPIFRHAFNASGRYSTHFCRYIIRMSGIQGVLNCGAVGSMQ